MRFWFFLQRAEDRLPKARLPEAKVLADAGHRSDAAQELEKYIASLDRSTERPELEAWLEELKR